MPLYLRQLRQVLQHLGSNVINQLVNNYYVLDYLALVGVDQPQVADPRNFWSSQEVSPVDAKFVQRLGNNSWLAPNPTQNTLTATITSPMTSLGNSIVVGIKVGTGDVVQTVTDTQNNPYVKIVEYSEGKAVSSLWVCYAPNLLSVGDTVTYTAQLNDLNMGFVVAEYSGIRGGVDITTGAANTDNSVMSGSITLSQSTNYENELAITLFSVGSTSGAISTTSNFVEEANDGAPVAHLFDQLLTTKQTPSMDFSWTNAGSNWAATMSTFIAQTAEVLILDLGSVRPVNCLTFEIIGKPIDFTLEYLNGTTWTEVTDNPDFNNEQGVTYVGGENPWIYIERHFAETTTAQYLRITFTRRPDRFPFQDSDYFPWSIDVRNLRLLYLMDDPEDYVVDTGKDILGNTFRTELSLYSAANATDGNMNTYWKSFPNIDPQAVECLYLDLRSGGDAVVIDEVYIDPITYGPHMHFYYSNDDSTADWDTKLWVPVPRHYILQKGFHALPAPTTLKYLKAEFTNLAPIPYNVPEYPNFHYFTYRRFPTWVKNYFQGVYTGINNKGDLVGLVDQIDIDPLALAFTIPSDMLSAAELNTTFPTDPTTLLQDYVKGVAAQQQLVPEAQQELESDISFRNSFQWQNDLSQELDTNRAFSRLLLQMAATATTFGAEDPAPQLLPPSIQSVPDLQTSQDQKLTPMMWFPMTCRHTYQIVRATRSDKVAYHVAIREIGAYRKNYTVADDPDSYVEIFGDSQNVAENDFIQSDIYWEVGP